MQPRVRHQARRLSLTSRTLRTSTKRQAIVGQRGDDLEDRTLVEQRPLAWGTNTAEEGRVSSGRWSSAAEGLRARTEDRAGDVPRQARQTTLGLLIALVRPDWTSGRSRSARVGRTEGHEEETDGAPASRRARTRSATLASRPGAGCLLDLARLRSNGRADPDRDGKSRMLSCVECLLPGRSCWGRSMLVVRGGRPPARPLPEAALGRVLQTTISLSSLPWTDNSSAGLRHPTPRSMLTSR